MYTCLAEDKSGNLICNRKFDEEEFELTNDKTKCIFHCDKKDWEKLPKKENYSNKNSFWIKLEGIIDEINKYNNELEEGDYKAYEFNGIEFPNFYNLNEKAEYSFSEDRFINILSNMNTDAPVFFNNCTFFKNVVLPTNCTPTQFIFEKDCKFIDCTINTNGNEIAFVNCTFFKNVVLPTNCTPTQFIFKKDCKFIDCTINTNENKVIFIGCEFYKKFSITNDFNEIDNSFIFNNCKFHGIVLLNSLKQTKLYISSKLFKECFFYERLEFYKVYIESDDLIKNCFFNSNEVRFSESDINSNIDFNTNIYSKIKKLIIKKTIFQGSVSIKDNRIEKLFLKDSAFNKNLKLSNIIIEKNTIETSSFNNLIALGKVEFNSNVDLSTNFFEKANFFRFKFFGVKNRETARIIKDSFEKQNNIIEANKYYALEMKKREEELKKTKSKNFSEWLIFKIHGLTSNHSQDWLLAFFWILFFSMGYSLFQYLFLDKCVSSVYPIASFFIGYFLLFLSSYFLLDNIIEKSEIKKYTLGLIFFISGIYLFITNDLTLELPAKIINPVGLKDNDTNGVSLIFKVIIAYLIYQFIISIRQNTRRK